MSVQGVVTGESPVVVAVDVGKRTVALSVTDAARHRLLGPVDFEMTGRGLDGILTLIKSRLAGMDVPVRVGIEAAGHYHRPLLTPSVWPADWQVLELNPAHVAEQRRVQGRRRIKTDALDLEAITELVLSGRGLPVTAREAVIGELGAWAAHRTRRVQARTATKNPAAGPAGPGLPRADAGPAGRARHQSGKAHRC